MAALDRAVALAQRQNCSLSVPENLDLDVPRAHDRLLDVERTVTEGRLGLRRRGAVGRVELRGRVDEAHSTPAAARRGLEQDGVADLAGDLAGPVQVDRAVGSGHERHARFRHGLLGRDLVAHGLDRLGARTDEDEVVVLAGQSKGGVLGEEAPARVHGVAFGRRGGGDE